MKGSWKVIWFSSVELQLNFVNQYSGDQSLPPHITDVQLVCNPWRFWAPYGVYFRSAWLFSQAIPDKYKREEERLRHNFEVTTGEKL